MHASIPISVVVLIGCASATRSAFHQSDPSFRPSRGSAPRVYLERDLDQVPPGALKSVGLVEVTVPESSGIARAIELAAEKGREVGCWILVEHEAFAALQTTRQSRVELSHGAIIMLAHGGGGGGGDAPSSEGMLTVEFDCVIEARSAAGPRANHTSASSTIRPVAIGPRT